MNSRFHAECRMYSSRNKWFGKMKAAQVLQRVGLTQKTAE